MIWSASALSEALNVEVNPEICGEQIQFNSNSIEKGDLFIALKGTGDGHDYAIDALEQGANALIISREIKGVPSNKVIMVKDTFASLQKMAEYKRKKSKAKFIGITGSVGKTSTKEALKIILNSFGKTFASRANFNNYLGVPINLASIPDDIEYAIFEMGMNHSGEIHNLTKMVKPDIAIITWVSEAHLEFFNSVEDIADSKSEIFEGLSKDGIAIINLDNKYYDRIMFNLGRLAVKNSNIYTFGKHEKANSRLKLYENLSSFVHLVYEINAQKIDLNLPFIAEHYVKNFAACLMVAALLDLDVYQAAMQLSKVELIDGRGKIINVAFGEKKCQIICDYYNANPASVKASLEYFKQIKHPKKVAIIGNMPELGQTSAQLHIDLAPFIINSGASKVFLVGSEAHHIHDFLPKTIESACFDSPDSLIANIDNLITDGELILIKGARKLQLERIVQYLEGK